MSRRAVIAIAITLVGTGVYLGWSEMAQFLAVDQCLDAGGSFDYGVNACDFTASHPAEATLIDVAIRLLIAMALAAGGVVLLMRRRGLR